MIGTTLAHYRITGELGSGGMGEVWRAEDTKLGREVALKVLPAEFVGDEQRLERFEREARAVAALNHPSIVTIHSVEEAEGIRFLTMELVEGRTLDGVTPEGGMALGTFLDTATPIAEAIAAAHDKGVVHRDLKPQNVMVDRDGRVKVLDFGLAKLQEASDGTDVAEAATEALTGVGMVVGTVPYMSPEQIESHAVDHRTDIFSLGVLLYEMATGERPFSGGSSPALMSSILKDVPTSVVEMRSDLPRHLGRVIGRCLEKDRHDRYQTARDVFNELRALRRESASSTGTAALQPRVEHVPSRAAQPSSAPNATGRVSSATGSTRLDEGFWVAVLPFACRAADAAVEALAGGLTEDTITGLSRFSYLRVISRSSTSRYAGRAVDVRAVGEELGARYVMEGSIRQAGSVLRVAVQLVDAFSGAHLWAETFNRSFNPDEIFELQDDLAPRIVSTIADMNGILPHTMSESIRSRPVDDLSPYEAVLRSFAYFERVTAEELVAARSALELAVQNAPAYADAWAMLALLCAQEYGQGFSLLADSLASGATAARRAVETGPSNHLAYFSLAQVLFFQKEYQTFRNAVERAATLNPMDGNSIAFLGELLTYSGDVERGLALAKRAKQLNPNHPGWYWYVDCFHSYRQRDYPAALSLARKVSMPGHWGEHCMIAAVCGQLGDRDAAGKALRNLLDLRPDFADVARREFGKWWDSDFVEHMIEGLRKAGLRIDVMGEPPADPRPSDVTAPAEESGSIGIAVLPFTDMSPAKDQDYFCEGMAEEIMNALTRLEGLRVIARTSAFRFRGEQDLRKVGEALGVDVVLEGSVRRAGQKLRITAQLVDIADDSHIWSERFDREMTDVFEIQDEIADAIANKLHVSLGASEPAGRSTNNIAAYEALVEARHFFFQFTPAAAERALVCLQRALSLEPDYPDALVLYAFYHVMMGYMFADPREVLPPAKSLAERALELDPHHGEAHAAVAVLATWTDWDWAAGERHYRRALELAPASARAHELYGLSCLLATGRLEEALSELDRAVELDPLSALYAGNRGRVLTCSRRFEEAEESCRRGLAIIPGQLLVQVELIYALTFQRKFDEAVAIGRRAIETHGPSKAPLNALVLSLALAGEHDEARQLLEVAAERGSGAYRSPLTLGLVHAVCSEMDAAIECTQRAIDERDPLLWYLQVHPMFDSLRDDPRYPELLRRMNLIEGGQQ